MDKMKSKDHPLHFLLPRPLINQPEYNLRKNADKFNFLMNLLPVGQKGQITILHLDILTNMINFYCSTNQGEIRD